MIGIIKIKILRFIIFVYALAYYVKLDNFRYFKIVTSIWLFIFFITSIDLFIEHMIGHNLLGNVSYMPGRLSGFLGDELKIGNYYLGFYFLSLATLTENLKKKKILSVLIIIFFSYNLHISILNLPKLLFKFSFDRT